MTKPILLLDMDGPLADFDIHFWERCQELGYKFDIDHPSEQRHRFLTEHIPNRRERAKARGMVNAAGWFSELPITPGAQEGVPQLLEHFEVWVCTKPLEINPTCLNDKQTWIQKYFPMLDRRMITAPDKSMIHGDILLDDAPKFKWFNTATWKPVIFDLPFNQSESYEHLARWTWNDSVENLVKLTNNLELIK